MTSNTRDALTETKSLRIGLLTPEYPTVTGTGGIAAYVQELAYAYRDLGHEPHVIVYPPEAMPVPDFDGVIPLYSVTVPRFASLLPFPIARGSSMWMARRVSALSRRLRLDILEAPEYNALTGLLSFFKPTDLPVVVRLQLCEALVWQFNQYVASSARERARLWLMNRLEKRAIETADSVTSTSRATADLTRQILNINRNDFHVIPNPAGRIFFNGGPVSSSATRAVVVIGRLEWRKGQDILARAIPAVLAKHPDVKFIFAGDDTKTAPGNSSMYEYMMSVVSPREEEAITYLGYVDPARVRELLESATICVFPSRWEGLPVAVAEAMAMGKTIVVSDSAPMKELIAHEQNGLVAETENPASYADAMIRLLDEPLLCKRLADNARSTADSRLSGREVAEANLCVYRRTIRELAGRKRPNTSHERGTMAPTHEDTAFERLDPSLTEWSWDYPWHLHRYQFVSQLLDRTRPLRILDAACGCGLGSKHLAEVSQWTIVGIDRDSDALAIARGEFSHPSVVYLQDDCESLESVAERGPFDAIVSMETIEHLHHPDSFLRRCLELLAPNGQLILSTPNAAVTSPTGVVEYQYHVHEFKPVELESFLLAHGFRTKEFFGQDYSTKGLVKQRIQSTIGSLRDTRVWNVARRVKRAILGTKTLLLPTTNDYRIRRFASPSACEELGSAGPPVVLYLAEASSR
jgi:glycosyltransferase involved in cell wall biosynthesis/2-polyprenyl-3-methyl-5-hydroxy-6-metoxy-1,4-benzoquinol methylase